MVKAVYRSLSAVSTNSIGALDCGYDGTIGDVSTPLFDNESVNRLLHILVCVTLEFCCTLHNPAMGLVHHSLDALEVVLIAWETDSFEHLVGSPSGRAGVERVAIQTVLAGLTLLTEHMGLTTTESSRQQPLLHGEFADNSPTV